jgi:hypothetical protein
MRQSLKSSALLLPLMLIAGAASAGPEADIQRALLERQQRTDELILRIQQSQPSPGNLRQQQELDTLHLQSFQRLQNLNAQQLRQFDGSQQVSPLDPNAGRMQMLQQQQQFERDRQLELQQLRWEEQRLRDSQRQPLPQN